jgi:hypothetical protein
MWTSRVFGGIGVFGINSGFAHLGGPCLILGGVVHIADSRAQNKQYYSKYIISIISINLSYLSILSGGEGDYRGIYDIGFKRGF